MEPIKKSYYFCVRLIRYKEKKCVSAIAQNDFPPIIPQVPSYKIAPLHYFFFFGRFQYHGYAVTTGNSKTDIRGYRPIRDWG